MNKNKIPQGYKDSPLGIIPENWEVKRLGEVFNTLKSFSFSRNQMTSQKQELRYIHYGDIHTGAEQDSVDLSLGTLPYILNDLIPVEKIKDENFPLLKNGDIILADASEDYDGIGKAWEILNTANNKIIAGLHTIVLRERTNYTSIGYGRYLFRNTQTSKSLKRIAQGTKVYSISYKHLSKLHLLFPPLSEQQKIAKILSCWDEAIEKQTQLIKQLELRKRGLMQQLLTGKQRLKGFEKKWKSVKLGEIGEFVSGIGFSENEQGRTKGVPFFKVSDMNIHGNEFTMNFANNYVSDEQIKRCKYKVIHSGAVIFAKVGAAILLERKRLAFNFLIDNNMMAFIPYNNNLLFIKYLFDVIALSKYIQVGALPSYNASDLNTIKTNLPLLEEQTAIANILMTADREIQKEMELLTALRSQKKGLMQQLLTGKKRVKI